MGDRCVQRDGANAKQQENNIWYHRSTTRYSSQLAGVLAVRGRSLFLQTVPSIDHR